MQFRDFHHLKYTHFFLFGERTERFISWTLHLPLFRLLPGQADLAEEGQNVWPLALVFGVADVVKLLVDKVPRLARRVVLQSCAASPAVGGVDQLVPAMES